MTPTLQPCALKYRNALEYRNTHDSRHKQRQGYSDCYNTNRKSKKGNKKGGCVLFDIKWMYPDLFAFDEKIRLISKKQKMAKAIVRIASCKIIH